MNKFKSILIYFSRFLGYWVGYLFRHELEEIQIFSQPDCHWFVGYYDVVCIYKEKLFFHEVKGRHIKSPKKCEIKYVDMNSNSIGKISTSHAVNWQLGSRLQVCGTDLVFNDIIDGLQVHRILDLENGEERLIEFPFWLKNKERDMTVTIDYERLWKTRKGYGYRGTIKDDLKGCVAIYNYNGDKKHRSISLNRICCDLNLETGGYLNHVIANQNFSFILTTYNLQNEQGRRVVPILYDFENDQLSSFEPGRAFSHPAFISNSDIGYFDGNGYCTIDLRTYLKDYIMKTDLDGHPTFLSPSYFVTDTYPDKFSKMKIYSYRNGRTDTIIQLFSHPMYQGDARCDLHPKYSKGNIIFDIPKSGGRAFGITKVSD